MLRERKRLIGTSCAILACAATCFFLFRSPEKKTFQKQPIDGFSNAQVLIDSANTSSMGQHILLGKKELDIAELMKEREALNADKDVLHRRLKNKQRYASELNESLRECNKTAEECAEQLSGSVKQNLELGAYFAKCVESSLKSFHLIKYYFGVVDKEELKMIKEENERAGVNGQQMSNAEKMFALFDYFIKEIKPQKSEKGQLPRRVGAVLTDRKGDCDEQAITFAWLALVTGWKVRVVFVDYGKTAHAYPQILIGGKKDYEKFVLELKQHYKMDYKLFKKIIPMGTNIENGEYWFTFDTTGPIPGLRIYPDLDNRTRVVYPDVH